MFRSGTRDIDTGVNRLYRAFKTTAERYHYTFQRPEITVGGRPSAVFLGNHSSGKSTFINHLLGGPPVQDTGVAPTDDRFTVILYGDVEQDYYGPAAIGQLPAEFASIATMGPAFLQHVQVKIRKRDYLKHVNLIDSPGMIDTAEGHATRSYDFPRAVRKFAELSDLVFFLFDPDKPGTTAEAVSVLSKCLFGIEFKLRVLLNKSDTFDSMYDFARAYGTLCWNLARVLRMKDLPTIYTTYTPQSGTRVETKVSLDGFDRHRAQILEQLRSLPQRRYDSMLANVAADFTRLELQSRVLGAAASRLAFRRVRDVVLFIVATLAAIFVSWFLATHVILPGAGAASLLSWRRLLALLFTIAVTGVCGLAAAMWAHLGFKRLRARLVNHVDDLFEEEYAVELAPGARSDLRQYWQSIRDDVAAIIQSGAPLPLFGWGTRRRLYEVMERVIPDLATRSRKDVKKGR
ncbi:MAG: dynamin family protein [Kiritimatiellia bacterium]|jgi:hypothetical protein